MVDFPGDIIKRTADYRSHIGTIGHRLHGKFRRVKIEEDCRAIDLLYSSLSLDDVRGGPGEMMATTLHAWDLSDWAGGKLTIAYDTTVVEQIVSVEATGLASGFALRFHDDGTGLASIALASDQAISGSGSLATVWLRLSSSALEGDTSSLTLAEVLLNDIAGRDFVTSALQRTIIRQSAQVSVAKTAIYLPMVALNYATPASFPVSVGSAIAQRPVAYQGEVFYTNQIRIPNQLPSGGRFYFSAQGDAVLAALVDDEMAVRLAGGGEAFVHRFTGPGFPQAAIVEVPRATMEQLVGQDVTVEYRDVNASVVEASSMWLIWMP